VLLAIEILVAVMSGLPRGATPQARIPFSTGALLIFLGVSLATQAVVPQRPRRTADG